MSNLYTNSPLALANPAFKLEYPQSIGVFASYADAQRAVDALSDQHFPVANLAIVGTDLKLVERVTGRKTWATVLRQGFFSGLSTSVIIALMFLLLDPSRNFAVTWALALLIGTGISMTFAVIGYAMSKGQRDFTSISQTVPSKFEILCEHKVAADARALLSGTPQARSAAFDPNRPQAPGYPAPGGAPQPPYPPQAYPYPQQPYPMQPPYGAPVPVPQPPQAPAAPGASEPPSTGTGPYGSFGANDGLGTPPRPPKADES